MRLRYTLPTLAELASILDYIADRSPKGAARIHTRICAVTDLLLCYQVAGRAVSMALMITESLCAIAEEARAYDRVSFRHSANPAPANLQA
jgi:hypothetical protein